MSRVLVVDDNALVRIGLRTLLESAPDLTVVEETASGTTALRMLDELHPDVVTLDLMLPDIFGLEVARQARRSSPDIKIIIVSAEDGEGFVVEAQRAGALGYVVKKDAADELLRGVREALAGRRYLSSSLSRYLAASYLDRLVLDVADPYDALTGREREVLQLVSYGLSSKDIANRLGIGVRTVESHRARFMRKLALHSQTDLIRYALKRGLMPLDPDA